MIIQIFYAYRPLEIQRSIKLMYIQCLTFYSWLSAAIQLKISDVIFSVLAFINVCFISLLNCDLKTKNILAPSTAFVKMSFSVMYTLKSFLIISSNLVIITALAFLLLFFSMSLSPQYRVKYHTENNNESIMTKFVIPS